MPNVAHRLAVLLFAAGIIPLLAACADDPRAMILAEESPVQPIFFQHTVHVGTDSIPCAYCHFSADRSEEAGIPSVGTCMGCHRFVQGSSDEFRTEIQKVMESWGDSTAIPWVRVHTLPEFVQFTHKPHIRAGVACADCHGDVGAMERVERVAPLTMGWCVNCHRDKGAPDDCAACHF